MGNIKLWLWVFFVMIIVANGCLDEERSALFELQADMIGAALTWVGYNESGSQDCCSWGGVQCSLATGRVIKLDLESFDGWNFNASLFLSFKSLEVLILSRNHIGLTKIEGIDKLSHLTNLKVLDLRHNSLHPSVLSSLCRISSLEVLKLSSFRWKNYTGHIGEGNVKCRGLRNLRVLLLNNYGIDDISILSVLGLGTHIGLKNLEKLYLSGNSFNSSIFSSLKDLPSLTHLDLSYNEIHGKIEMSDIIALSNLKFLNLEGNEFESFVTTKGSKRVSCLRKLELGGSNSNSTKVLQSLKSFSSLHSLSYIDTHLTAPAITYALANLSTLEYLYLDRSSLNANFPSSIGQMTSLKVLRLAFGGNNGILPSQGWCELKNIQELSLSGFEGTLPSCLGNLTSLKYLDLNGNGFTGNIDSHPFWRRLTSLEFLDISSNQFVVPLSFKLFANHSKLIYLDVSSNTITTDTEFQNWIPSFQLQLFAIHGNTNLQKLPSFLHYQYDLRILAIDGNQLPGNFPTWLLENNTRLGGLYASYNAFIGPLELPSTSLPRLHTIYVSNNKLNGHIPANFSSAFPKINRLDMSHNLIEGPIPSGVSGIPLQYVDLSHNFLSGGVPSDLISSPTLYDLRLSNNKLKGQIFLKDFRSGILSYLYLNGNNFEGPLPSNIFLRDLVVLDASNNNFSGEIPRRIRDNSRLLQLDLSNNHFECSIPVEICNMKSIKVLAMSENRLSGNIPSCVSSLPLQHIHLDKNQLDGGLEYVLSNISSLITLDLGYNSFTGSIPHTIGSLSNLNFLLLNHNQLEGNIPAQICLLNELSIMDLSFNKIYGSLLPCLGNLIQAKRDVEIWFITYTSYSNEAWSNFLTWKSSTMHYHNRYSMGRPDSSTMDVVTQVQFSTKRNTYTYEGSVLHYMSGIDLSSNKLTGEIPIELGNLSNIHALNLSHNHLIGRIPESFSYLLEVESLDLSYNSLNGSIPVGLLELHPLEVFSVAYNNLSGKVPDFKGQFGTFDKSSYEGNPFLCGYPLDNECRSTKLSNTSKNESDESDLDDKESFYIGFCVSYGAILLGLAAALCFNPHWRRAWFRLVESLMLTSYYFLLDNVVSPFKNWW